MLKRKAPKSWAEQLADLDDPAPRGTMRPMLASSIADGRQTSTLKNMGQLLTICQMRAPRARTVSPKMRENIMSISSRRGLGTIIGQYAEEMQ